MQEARVKNYPSKLALAWGPELRAEVLSALALLSECVGNTLGPGGRLTLLEHGEVGRAPFATKDGVTTATYLRGAYASTSPHREHGRLALEAAAEACLRTGAEAGDGTTTTAILAHALVANIFKFCDANPTWSPHAVARTLEKLVRDHVEPTLRSLAKQVLPEDPEGQAILRAVAKTSANGDEELADAVIQCLAITGDDGSVTLAEEAGAPAIRAEKQDGYGIAAGYDDSCGRFYPMFVNDQGGQQAVLYRPVFLLYHGRVERLQQVEDALAKVLAAQQQYRDVVAAGGHYDGPAECRGSASICLVAAGFSEQVQGYFGAQFGQAERPQILPLVLPQDAPIQGWRHQLLLDLAAVTGAKVHDPTTIGNCQVWDAGPGVERVEMSRFRTNIVGYARGQRHDFRLKTVAGQDPIVTPVRLTGKDATYEGVRIQRAAEVRKQRDGNASELDRRMTTERLAKLTNGLARLVVVGASNAAIRERRDRAEDAVCAVRAALGGGGALPGAGWGLLRAGRALAAAKVSSAEDQIRSEVLQEALEQPLRRLLHNAGLSDVELVVEESGMDGAAWSAAQTKRENFVDLPGAYRLTIDEVRQVAPVYDAAEHRWVDAWQAGILDAAPAVIQALRNSLAVASVVGIPGSSIVFITDPELERREALEAAAFKRNAGTNEANERQ